MTASYEPGTLESQTEHGPRHVPVTVDEVPVETFDYRDAEKEKDPLDVEEEIYGLRGVAAFLVVCHHWSLLTFSMRIHKGYGSDAQPLFVQLPIVRLFVSGYWAVCVFFVISGFALSYKPLKLLHQKRQADFAIAAASAAFRRFIRIFGPPIITTFLIALMVYNGWFENKGKTASGTPSLRPPKGETLSDQLRHWLMSTIGFADPLSRNLHRGDNYIYDPVLWTIPIEFDCSLVIFMAHIAFSRLSSRARLFFHVFIAGYALYLARWEFFLFLAGLLCADVHFHLQSVSQETSYEDGDMENLPLWSKPWRRDSFTRFQYAISSSPTLTRLSQSLPWRRDSFTRFQSAVFRTSGPAFPVLKAFIGIVSFFGALWLLSCPHLTNDAAITPGYKTLAAMAPSQFPQADKFWIPLGAVILVFAVDRTPILQRLFTNRFTQYLGRISYAIYLVHGSLLWLYGWPLIAFFMPLTGSGTNAQYGWGVFLPTICFFPVVICVADFAQRFVDAKMVSFSVWFEKKLVSKAA
ncbi:hard surface induced protein [Colletotrichum karsti]|uniref:Hard surface induced protein n=1 Tax=Colletotrichum karsti TaxID=1095194 RepID=A0A9P6IG24_9PEZI|nr:hard surface induced protein [Colletotrichum karsti]KAF9879906.1 hard surface induced protein [Colletotrichum karsti]